MESVFIKLANSEGVYLLPSSALLLHEGRLRLDSVVRYADVPLRTVQLQKLLHRSGYLQDVFEVVDSDFGKIAENLFGIILFSETKTLLKIHKKEKHL